MFAIFRKRSGKLSADLAKLEKQAAAIVTRAKARVDASYEVINVLQKEIHEAECVIEAIKFGSVLDR